MTGQGKRRQDKTRQEKAREGKARQGPTRERKRREYEHTWKAFPNGTEFSGCRKPFGQPPKGIQIQCILQHIHFRKF